MPLGTASLVARAGRLCSTAFVSVTFLAMASGGLWTGMADAATSVTVAGKTSTQIVLSYAAPDLNPCTIEASESPSYAPLVNDANPSLFPGANLDSRPGSLSAGTTRVVVIGKRTSERAADNKVYSRALRVYTTHYYRLTCGTQVQTGSTTTANIPNGFTRGETPPVDPANPGGYLWPTVSDIDRTQTFIDPWAGTLIRRLGLPGDTQSGNNFHPTAGFHTICSNVLTANGLYHCALNVGDYRGLYGINPTDGSVRYLGDLYFYGQQRYGLAGGVHYCQTGGSWLWDETDPNVYYCGTFDTNGKRVIVKVTYTGNDTPVSPGTLAALTPVNLTPAPNDYNSLLVQFAPTFDPTKFGCAPDAVQGRYLPMGCRRADQDSYAWIAVYDLGNKLPLGGGGTGGVVAAVKMWEQTGGRWCGLHGLEDVGHVPITALEVQRILGGGVGHGPYQVILQTALPAATGQATISVSSNWNTAWGTAPASFQSGDPLSPELDYYLMPVQAGDWFYHGTEWFRIVQVLSRTQWVVQRAIVNTSPVAHQVGDPLSMWCNANDTPGPGYFGTMLWDFLAAPTGNDPSNFAMRTGTVGNGHDSMRGNYYIVDAGRAVIGPLTNHTVWSKPPDFDLEQSPLFAGAYGPAPGNFYARHPAYAQVKAVGAELEWFADVLSFTGGDPFQNQGLGNASNQLLEGTLFKYVYNGLDTTNYGGDGLNRKQLPTLATAGSKILRDISGPSSHISGDPADAYTYCIAVKARECRTASDVGGASSPDNIYINAPDTDPSYRYCFGAETSLTGKIDLCLGDAAMEGPGLLQVRVVPSLTRTARTGRVLTRLFASYRDLSSSAKILPDGSWIIYAPNLNGRPTVPLLVKVPPQPTDDGVDRSSFIPVVINVPAPTTVMADKAVIEFGYAEQGYYCTSRAETCVATSSTLNPAAPFQFETSETITGVPCVSGCTIAIPAIPQRVVYWLVKYRDASGADVEVGPAGVGIEGVYVSVSDGSLTGGGSSGVSFGHGPVISSAQVGRAD